MKPLIIGVGNRYRSDDGVGLVVLDQLKTTLTKEADFIACQGDASELMNHWPDRKEVIIIDACHGGKAGTVTRLDGLGESLAAYAPASSHAFSVAEVIELAGQLDALPESLTIFAVAGNHFDPGESLSPEVAQAVNSLCEQIRREITQEH